MNDTTLSQASVSKGSTRLPWGRIAAWGTLAILLVTLALGLRRSQQGPIQIGHPAPDFSLNTYDNQVYTLSQLRGKVVVINFWASWCKPCEQEAADLETAWRHYRSRDDILFLGIAWTDTPKNSQAYLEKFEITYPNGPDLKTRISQIYRITGVPETYIIDKNGILAYVKLSPFLSLEEIKAAIDPLLSP